MKKQHIHVTVSVYGYTQTKCFDKLKDVAVYIKGVKKMFKEMAAKNDSKNFNILTEYL